MPGELFLDLFVTQSTREAVERARGVPGHRGKQKGVHKVRMAHDGHEVRMYKTTVAA